MLLVQSRYVLLVQSGYVLLEQSRSCQENVATYVMLVQRMLVCVYHTGYVLLVHCSYMLVVYCSYSICILYNVDIVF